MRARPDTKKFNFSKVQKGSRGKISRGCPRHIQAPNNPRHVSLRYIFKSPGYIQNPGICSNPRYIRKMRAEKGGGVMIGSGAVFCRPRLPAKAGQRKENGRNAIGGYKPSAHSTRMPRCSSKILTPISTSTTPPAISALFLSLSPKKRPT